MSGRTLVDTNVLFYALGGKTDPRTATARKALDDHVRREALLELGLRVSNHYFVQCGPGR